MSKDDDVESGEVRAGFIFWLLWLWLWLFGPAAIFKNRSAGLERIVLSSAVCYIYIYLVGGGAKSISIIPYRVTHLVTRDAYLTYHRGSSIKLSCNLVVKYIWREKGIINQALI